MVANEGSFNNELGMPLTCCRMTNDTDVLVSELGMRGPGQIAQLAALLRPTVGIVTSVAGVHLELLGSLEAIADAKGELVEALDADGVAVLAADDARVAAMARRTVATVVTFGTAPSADFRATDIELDRHARARFVLHSPAGRHDVTAPVRGMHNVGNALAALGAATASGVGLPAAIAGLAEARVSRWRLQLESVGDVSVNRVVGHADVSTGDGDIWIRDIDGTAAIKTANGDIQIGSVESGAVDLKTAAGHLDIGVEVGIAAWVDASTQFGRVLNLMGEGAAPASTERTVEIHARTAFGDISIRRS